MNDPPDELVRQNLHLVQYAAERLHAKLPACVELGDLIQWGFFGLADAARRFDPARGVKFSTFAAPRIRGAMLDALRDFDWVPRLTRSRARKLGDARATLTAELGRAPSASELAGWLKITPAELAKVAGDVTREVVSLSRKWFETDANRDVFEIDVVADPKSVRATEELGEIDTFERILAELPGDTHRRVVTCYYAQDLTMREIGVEVGLTESRISQIHSESIAILKARIVMDEATGIATLPDPRPLPADPPAAPGRRLGNKRYSCDQLPGREFTHTEAAEESGIGASYLYQLIRMGAPAGERKLTFRRLDLAEAAAAAPAPASTPAVVYPRAQAARARRESGRAIARSGAGLTTADLRRRLEAKRDAEIAAIQERFAKLIEGVDLIADVLAEEAA